MGIEPTLTITKNKTLRLHVLMIDLGTLFVSFLIHYLLSSTNQRRSIRLTNPLVVEYSFNTHYSSRLPPQLVLAGLENFLKNHVGFGTLHGREPLSTV